MAFSHTYDTATPDGSVDSPTEADDRIKEIKAALQERLAVEHVFALTGTEVSGANTGKHTAITTTSIVNAGALANTGNLTINTDKFTIDAATGNVVVAGTLGVTGISTLAKGSLLASSDAPTTNPMIANKKYVDDQDATKENTLVTQATASIFGSWTNKDSLNATLVKDAVYKAGSDGFVTAYVNNGTAHLSFYTDGSNPPTTMRRAHRSYGTYVDTGCLVKKDDYFKVLCDYGTPIIYWLPIGTGACVKQ